jgi:hypothetical protein
MRALAELEITRDDMVEPLALLVTALFMVIAEVDPDLVARVKGRSEWEGAEQSLTEAPAVIEQRFGVVEEVATRAALACGTAPTRTFRSRLKMPSLRRAAHVPLGQHVGFQRDRLVKPA